MGIRAEILAGYLQHTRLELYRTVRTTYLMGFFFHMLLVLHIRYVYRRENQA
jgi:hypothetical protein